MLPQIRDGQFSKGKPSTCPDSHLLHFAGSQQGNDPKKDFGPLRGRGRRLPPLRAQLRGQVRPAHRKGPPCRQQARQEIPQLLNLDAGEEGRALRLLPVGGGVVRAFLLRASLADPAVGIPGGSQRKALFSLVPAFSRFLFFLLTLWKQGGFPSFLLGPLGFRTLQHLAFPVPLGFIPRAISTLRATK